MSDRLPDPSLFKVNVELQVRWGDLDALGHVNNARYFTYFEMARLGYIEAVSPGREMFEEGKGPIIASTGCDFLRPVGYPATLLLGTRTVRVGETSIEVEHLVRDRDSGRIHALGRVVLVWFDYQANRKPPSPDGLREGARRIDGV